MASAALRPASCSSSGAALRFGPRHYSSGTPLGVHSSDDSSSESAHPERDSAPVALRMPDASHAPSYQPDITSTSVRVSNRPLSLHVRSLQGNQ